MYKLKLRRSKVQVIHTISLSFAWITL